MKGFFNQTVDIELEGSTLIPVGIPCIINGLIKEDSFNTGIGVSVTIEAGVAPGIKEPTDVVVYSGAISSTDERYQQILHHFINSEAEKLKIITYS